MNLLLDDQWQRLEPLLTGRKGDPGASGRNNRLFIDAVLWQIGSQRSWSQLPEKFGKWSTVYMRFKRWNECGAWLQLQKDFQGVPDLLAIIDKIVNYGDSQLLRITRRARRKNHREMYKETVRQAKGDSLSISTEDDSTSHWLSLIADIHEVPDKS